MMDNLTAKVSCFARAYHFNNNPVRVFDDAAAMPLLGPDYDRIAQSMAQGASFFMPGFRGSGEEALRLIVEKQLAPSVLGRSAFCETALRNEIRLGCGQAVILASGYDTFAIRSRDASLSVFELDLPEMLADKQARMERAGLVSRAVFVPCDLSDSSWKERLLQSGFLCGVKSFASLLGISYYLEKSAFRTLIEALAGIFPEGSALCLDYPSDDDGLETRTNRALAADAGERMQARYAPREMETLLADCGFPVYEHLDHEQMTSRFFSAYNQSSPGHSMEAPKGVRYALAVRK